MAVVKLGPKVKVTLHKSIRYAINPDKTDNGRLVSTNYGLPGDDHVALARPMLRDLQATPGGDGPGMRKAYHVIQSFDPRDDVTAEQVHDLGVRLAEEITQGEYKYVVATHTDKAHLHNHIIICAANTVTRRKMELPLDAIDQWRALSDRMCREAGLGVLPEAPSSTPGRDGEEPSAHRRGESLAELYATAKGKGIKDHMRTVIDLAAAQGGTWDELTRRLSRQGVGVTIRGRHVTWTWNETGFKVRDDKLGAAYDMVSVMARMGHATVTPITFNQRLVEHIDREQGTVRVWLPGSKRSRLIAIPLEQVVVTGSTWRAFLPDRREQVILDRHDQFVAKIRTVGLYEWFGQPDARIGMPAASERLIDVTAGTSDAQRRYYAAVGAKVDRVRAEARALTVLMEGQRAGKDATDTVLDLRGRIQAEHDSIQAAVVALADAIEAGDSDKTVEARDDMERHERTLASLERDLAGMKTLARGHKTDPATAGQERRDRPEQARPQDDDKPTSRRGRHAR